MILTNEKNVLYNKFDYDLYLLSYFPVAYRFENSMIRCFESENITKNVLQYNKVIDNFTLDKIDSIIAIMSEQNIPIGKWDTLENTFRVSDTCSKYNEYIKIEYDSNKVCYIQPESSTYENLEYKLQISKLIDLDTLDINSIKYCTGVPLYKNILDNNDVSYVGNIVTIDLEKFMLDKDPLRFAYYENHTYFNNIIIDSYGCSLNKPVFNSELDDSYLLFNDNSKELLSLINNTSIELSSNVKIYNCSVFDITTEYRRYSPSVSTILNFVSSNIEEYPQEGKYTYIKNTIDYGNNAETTLYDCPIRPDYYSEYDKFILDTYFNYENLIGSFGYTITEENKSKQDFTSSPIQENINLSSEITLQINSLLYTDFLQDKFFKLIYRNRSLEVL